jgi:anaerobic selenocysteine-containing dehydrogenase
MDADTSNDQGITLEELKARGWMRLRYPDPFVPFATAFPSASGKLEFVSDRMAQAGLDPVAGYTPAHETSQRDTALARAYPLALVSPANHYFLNSLFANVRARVRRAFLSEDRVIVVREGSTWTVNAMLAEAPFAREPSEHVTVPASSEQEPWDGEAET